MWFFFFLVCVHALWLQARRTFPGGKGCCCIGSVPALTLARRGGPSLHGTATVAVGNPSGAGRQFLPPRKEQRKIIIIKKKISQKKKKKPSHNPATKPHKSSRGGGSGARVNPQILRVQQPGEGEAQPAARSPLPATALRSVLPRPAGAQSAAAATGPGRGEARRRLSAVPFPGRPRCPPLAPTFLFSPRRRPPPPHGAAPPRYLPPASGALLAAGRPGSSAAGGRRCPRRSPHSSGGGMRLGAALPGPASASRPNRQPPRRASRPPAPIGNAGARPGRTAPPSSAPGCGVSLPRCAPPLAAPARGRCASRRRAPARGGGTCAAPSAAEPGPAGSGSGAGRAAPGAHRLSRPARAGAPQRRAPSPAAAELRGGKPGRRAAPPGSAPGAAAGAGGTAGAELVEVRESRREVGFFASPWGFFRSPQAAAAPRLCGPSRPRPPPAFRGCFGGD